MKLNRILMAVASAIPCMLAAQDINTEITIEREVVPEQRAAARPDVAPRLVLPQVKPVNLSLADRASATVIPPYMSRLVPAVADTADVPEQRRGYVSGGYLPVGNLDLSAGYRLWQSDRGWTGVFGQFNAKDYDRYYRNSYMVGAAQRMAVGADGRLRASVDFGQSRFNRYDDRHPANVQIMSGKEIKSHLSALNFSLGYDTRLRSAWELSVGAEFNMANYKELPKFEIKDSRYGKAVINKQWRLGFDASAEWHYNELSAWGVDIATDYINPDFNYFHSLIDRSCFDKFLLRVTPHYTYRTSALDVRAGISFSMMDLWVDPKPCSSCDERRNLNSMSNRFLVAPDLHVTWRPSGSFALWTDWTGRGEGNFLGTVYNAMPYANLNQIGGFSTIPVDIKAGVNFGPWRGASMQLRVNYVNAESWIMPSGYDADLDEFDLESLLVGAEVNYDYRSLLSLTMSYDRVVNDEDYYLWRDGAKAQFRAAVTVTPMRELSLRLSYLSRNGRWRQQTFQQTADGNSISFVSAGSISSLDFGATYNFNRRLGVFLSLENLLGREWLLVGGVPAQKFHGLVGATYLF